MNSPAYFLYLNTDNKDIIKKTAGLNNSGKLFLFSEKKSDKIYEYIFNESIINKFEDFGLEDYKAFFSGKRKYCEHSLISFAYYSDKKVYCYTDKFGVITYYYYNKNGDTIISNNSVLIAYLVNDEYSIESIYDALIFMKPYGNRTWFKNIYCLKPGEKLIYNSSDKSVNVRNYYSMYRELLEESNENYVDVFKDFFNLYGSKERENETGISLSGGSDSRAVLAGLLNVNRKFRCYSWGGDKYLELHKISGIVKDFKLNQVVINFKKLKENFDSFVEKGVFSTGGLLTAIHQYYFYGNLPRGINQFEGYLGSEFVKGELSDGMVTNIYTDIVKFDYSLKDDFVKYFPFFNENIKKDFIEYIYDNHSDIFVNVNSEKGKEKFRKYLFDFIPSKIFGGLIPQGLAQGLNYYLPYFSPHFLKSLFSSGYGIKNHISLRKDFPGKIKIIKAQAEIVKALNPALYKSLLDRNIRYAEVNYPDFISNNLMRFRNLKDKIKTRKYDFTGQVDFNDVKEHSVFQNMEMNKYFIDTFGNKSSGNNSLKYISYYFNVFDSVMKKNKINVFL